MCLPEVGQGHSPHLCLWVLSRQAGQGCGRRLLAPSPGHPELQQPQQQARPQTKGPARRCSLVQPRAARAAGAKERAFGARGLGRRVGSADPVRAGAAAPGRPGSGAQTPPGLARRRPPSFHSVFDPPVLTRPPRRPHNCNRSPGLRRSFSGRPAASAARRGGRHGCVLEELAGQRRG